MNLHTGVAFRPIIVLGTKNRKRATATLHIVGFLVCANEPHQSRILLRFYEPWVVVESR